MGNALNVEFHTRQQLDAREEELEGVVVDARHVDEQAVEAVPNAHVVFLRLDVHVGGVHRHRAGGEHLDDARDAERALGGHRVGDQFLDVLNRLHGIHKLGKRLALNVQRPGLGLRGEGDVLVAGPGALERGNGDEKLFYEVAALL